jgi:hypothetical protein
MGIAADCDCRSSDVANCFATGQSSAFVEASLGDCCCQRQSIQIPSRPRRNQITAVIKHIGCVSKANPKRIRQRDGYKSTAVSSVLAAYSKRIQSEYVKRMGTTRQRFQACRLRIGCVSKANTSKGWIRLDGGIKRIGCVSAAYPRCVVEAQDRQTDFFRMMTVVLESFQLLGSLQ